MMDEQVSFTDAPSEDESVSLTKMGRELFEVDALIEKLKADLETAKKQRHELATKKIPDYMLKIGQDRMGLEGLGVDLIREPYYHANIAAEWEDEKRQTAFDWLTASGNEDLIKTEFTISFPRHMYAVAIWLKEHLQEIAVPPELSNGSIPDATVKLGVAWNTLTSFVREQIEQGRELPLETLGATVGWIVKVKKRK